ncbi:hypothetical protein Tco_0357733 [Tanacetum coccineum]
MKSIKEGPFQMGTVLDVITGGTEGAVQQGPVRARVLNDLSAEEKEREYLNLQLKYQHLQESFENKRSQASQEAPDFRSFFKIKNLEHQIQEKDNVIGHLKDLIRIRKG